MSLLNASFVRRGALGVAAAGILTLAACGTTTTTTSSSTSATSSTAAASASSTAGSSTGSSSAGSSTGASSGSAADTTHNDADVMFVQMMIPHHRGAIEMAQLAPTRASSQQVKDLAAKIEAAQAPEIEQMTAWLQAWGVSESAPASDGMGGMDHGGADMSSESTAESSDDGMDGMDHGGMSMDKDGGMSASSSAMAMPGEMTAEQMQSLEAASGAEFDRLFLELMIVHHTGAVDMADTEIAQGSNPDAVKLAESIKASQTEEIAQMQLLLQSL